MNKSTALALSAVGFLLFLLLWEGFARSGVAGSAQVPAPSMVPGALLSEIQLGFWQDMVAASLNHYVIGLLLGSVLGVAFGVMVALLPRVSAAQTWIVRILRPIPPLAWIPFAINWFGVSETAAAFIISIGVFWINYFISLTAVEAVDKDLIEVAQSFGHRSAYARLTKVILPGALPGKYEIKKNPEIGYPGQASHGWLIIWIIAQYKMKILFRAGRTLCVQFISVPHATLIIFP